MNDAPRSLAGTHLTTPRAAAIAGIIFAVLYGTSLILIRTSIPDSPLDEIVWLKNRGGVIAFAVSLMSFGGIAFLWFIGVIRDRLGEFEDRFFSTVFLGSGLLYLATTFVMTALMGALVATYKVAPEQLVDSGLYPFCLDLVRLINTQFATKMSAVFMVSLGTIWFRTRTMPRWLAIVTYALALGLMLNFQRSLWVALFFPAWVLIISVYILVRNLRSGGPSESGGFDLLSESRDGTG